MAEASSFLEQIEAYSSKFSMSVAGERTFAHGRRSRRFGVFIDTARLPRRVGRCLPIDNMPRRLPVAS